MRRYSALTPEQQEEVRAIVREESGAAAELIAEAQKDLARRAALAALRRHWPEGHAIPAVVSFVRGQPDVFPGDVA